MEETKEIIVKKYETQAIELDKEVLNLAVRSKPTYDAMLLLMDHAKAFQKEIKEFFEPMKTAAHKAHRIICQQETDTLAPYKRAESLSKDKAGKWYLEEERKAQEKARKEQERLEAIAEEKRRQQVERLREFNQEKAAQLVEEKPIEVQKVEVKSRAEGSGFRMVDNWKARVVSLEHIPRKYLLPDMAWLNKMAKDQKGQNAPAGVEFFNNRYSMKR